MRTLKRLKTFALTTHRPVFHRFAPRITGARDTCKPLRYKGYSNRPHSLGEPDSHRCVSARLVRPAPSTVGTVFLLPDPKSGADLMRPETLMTALAWARQSSQLTRDVRDEQRLTTDTGVLTFHGRQTHYTYPGQEVVSDNFQLYNGNIAIEVSDIS